MAELPFIALKETTGEVVPDLETAKFMQTLLRETFVNNDKEFPFSPRLHSDRITLMCS